MKRTLLGMTALFGVVGLGSVGVYSAHLYLAPQTSVAQEQEPAPFVSARDVPLTPIPVASSSLDADERTSARPLPGTGRPSRRFPDQVPATENQLDSVAADDIPDAAAERTEAMPATRSAEPFGSRQRMGRGNSRFAEQPVAAELDEQEADASVQGPTLDNEPRRLSPVPVTEPAEPVDRYGRPAPARRTPRDIPEATSNARAEEPAAADEPQVAATTNPTELSAPDETDEGTGRPGDPQLSGSQAPTLTIEKTAPAEIQIGKPAKFLIKVRNTGSVVAQGVEIHDTVPQGTQLIETTPQAKRGPQGALVWDLGALKPGDEQTAELQLMPTAEGEIGSVATLHFRAEASVRTMSTKPMLTMEVRAPSKVMKGDEVMFKIRLSNPGTGAATGIVVGENVPQGLSHSSGGELEFEVGTLKPGESRELELALKAAEAGQVTNTISAQGEGNLQAEVQSELEVVAPQLQVSLAGPKRRYLERNATHNISVTNPGTASAKEIELVAVLPKELKFVEANNGGQFDAATHSVYWSLEELPPQEIGTVSLTTLPMKAGEAKLLIKSTAQQGLTDQREEVLAIEGLAAINFQLSDVNDPIEAGGQTSYEVRVTNQGSKAATNVRVVALLPREMKAISAEGPVRYQIEGQRVVFDALKQLAPKADTSYTIKVQAVEAGDLRVQVQISTDEIREPITKEESTRVFGDE